MDTFIIHSTSLIRTPGIFAYAQCLYQDGDVTAATEILNGLSDNKLPPETLIPLLSGDIPIEVEDDKVIITLDV